LTYTAPTIRELGSVAAYTLGSTHDGTIGYTKANNSLADFYTGRFDDTGVPCVDGAGVC